MSIWPRQVNWKRVNAIEIQLLFSCKDEHKSNYELVEISHRGYQVTDEASYSNFNFYSELPHNKALRGKKAVLPENKTKLSTLFESYINEIEYGTIFYHPTIRKENKYQEADNFIPLMFNARSEIISYAHFINESLILAIPDVRNKATFVRELMNTYLPDIVPDIFP